MFSKDRGAVGLQLHLIPHVHGYKLDYVNIIVNFLWERIVSLDTVTSRLVRAACYHFEALCTPTPKQYPMRWKSCRS